MYFVLCVVVGILFLEADCLTTWDVSRTSVRRQLWGAGIRVKDWWYLDGGEYWTQDAQSMSDLKIRKSEFDLGLLLSKKHTKQTKAPTLLVDLSIPWTTSNVTLYQIPKPSSVIANVSMKGAGLLWHERTNEIILYGGVPYYNVPSTSVLWALRIDKNDPGSGTWSEIRGGQHSMWDTISWPQYASYAATQTSALVLGGYLQESNKQLRQRNGMTYINSSAAEPNFETRSSTSKFDENGGIQEGAGHWISGFAGGKLSIFMGGVAYGDKTDPSLRSMSEITVYDRTTSTWYTQTASGDIPSSRRNFCLVGARATGASSYEIFMYGGSVIPYFSEKASDSRNVYILTIPAFRWIKTSDLTLPRAGPVCQVVKNQMLSFGGFDPSSQDIVFNIQEPWAYGLGIFNLKTLTWGTSFNPKAEEYTRAQVVDEYYSTRALYPIWDNDNLGKLMASAASQTSPSQPTSSGTTTTGSPSPAVPTGSSDVPSTPEPSPAKSNTAAIAGGAAGGAVAIILAVAALCFWRRRQKRKNAADSHIPELHNEPYTPEMSAGQVYPKEDPLVKQGLMHGERGRNQGPYEL